MPPRTAGGRKATQRQVVDQDVSSVIKENPVPVPPSTAETAPRPGTMGQVGRLLGRVTGGSVIVLHAVKIHGVPAGQNPIVHLCLQTGESAPEENRQNSLASTVSERVRKATLDMREQLQEVRQIACRGRLQGLWQPWCIAGLLCVLSVAAGATLQLRQSQAGQTASQQAHDSFMHQQEQTGQLWHDRLAGLEARCPVVCSLRSATSLVHACRLIAVRDYKEAAL